MTCSSHLFQYSDRERAREREARGRRGVERLREGRRGVRRKGKIQKWRKQVGGKQRAEQSESL